ncbi:MAG: hypothetical protein GY810_13060, partial [Aureispira sp.]|nr:hypothetical protein [Aureispira sp.]
LQNPHLEKIQNSEQEIENIKFTKLLQVKYQKRSYSEIWKLTYRCSLALSYLANSFSLLTGSFAISFFLFLQFENLFPKPITWLLIGVLALSIAFILELLKRSTSSNFFETGFSEKKWKLRVGTMVLLLSSFSIGLSFYGSTCLPLISQQAPPLHNLDSLEANYAQAITLKQLAIQDAAKNRRKDGSLRSQAQKTITILTKDISSLEQERRNRFQEAKQENESLLSSYHALTLSYGYLLGYMSILFELIFIACFYYVERYLWYAYLECLGKDELEEETEARMPVYTGNTGHERLKAIKTTFTHIKSNGDKVEYPRSQILTRLKDYQNRLEQSQRMVDNGDSSRDWQADHCNQRLWLHYWKQALSQLDGQLEQVAFLEQTA